MVSSKKHCPEHADANHGHSLLSFMKLASNKVKTALEKPNSFKRNINHRRFLQKQFKALVKSPEKVPTRKQFHLAKDNILHQMEYQSCPNNQMPPSPVNVGPLQFAPMQPYFPALDIPQTYANPFAVPTSEHTCDRRPCERRPCEKRPCEKNRLAETNYYSSLPDLVVEEDGFLTGEELTQAIELKDLFIPETDLTQYLNIRDSLELLASSKTNPDFDSWICHEFLKDDLNVF